MIKPCPFCGGAELTSYNNVWQEGDWYWVSRPDCHAQGPADLGKSGAIVAWNERKDEKASTTDNMKEAR